MFPLHRARKLVRLPVQALHRFREHFETCEVHGRRHKILSSLRDSDFLMGTLPSTPLRYVLGYHVAAPTALGFMAPVGPYRTITSTVTAAPSSCFG